MTVLQVIALHPYKLGGFEEYILSFAKKINISGHKVVFIFAGEPHPFIKEKLDEYKAKYHVEQIPQNTPGAISMLYRLIGVIKRSGADIIQGQFHPHDHLAVLAGFITGKPAYRTIRTPTSQSAHPLKYSSIVKAIISSFLSKSTFAVSNAVKEDLISNLHIPAKKIRVLYNGVNLERFCPMENDFFLHRELGISEKSKIVLCVAHARPMKGLDHLISAIPNIIKDHHDAHFVFCGGGPLESDMAYLAEKLGVSAKVHFLGVRDDVQVLLNCSYLFVMPSLAEAFGRVLLESMAMKKAVVASNIEGIAEIVQDEKTGLLVPPADSESLAKAVISLLDNPEKTAQMGTQGRKRAEELFDLNKRVANEIKIYEDELLS